MKILKELLYSNDHEWVKVEGNKAQIGITDFAQNSLGEIVFVELPEIDTEFSKNYCFGVVESVKAASDLCIPISGKVVEINENLVDSPELVNDDPYGSWIIAVEISDKLELDDLLKANEYEKICD